MLVVSSLHLPPAEVAESYVCSEKEEDRHESWNQQGQRNQSKFHSLPSAADLPSFTGTELCMNIKIGNLIDILVRIP